MEKPRWMLSGILIRWQWDSQQCKPIVKSKT
jgi:hypothetical protein